MASISDGIGERGGVDADLVCARLEDLRRIVGRANASANRERHEELARGAANSVEQRLAALVGRGDVEQHDFVGAFARVARGQRGRIAGIDEVDELHALDDAAVVNVEAGDDALGQHVPLQKVAQDVQAGCARLFRMELHAHDVAALHRGGERLDVFGDGSSVRSDRRLVGMREVDILAGRDSGKKSRARRASSEFQPT